MSHNYDYLDDNPPDSPRFDVARDGIKIVIPALLEKVIAHTGGLVEIDVCAIAFLTYSRLLSKGWKKDVAYKLAYLLAWSYQNGPSKFEESFPNAIIRDPIELGTLEYIPEPYEGYGREPVDMEYWKKSGANQVKIATMLIQELRTKWSDVLDDLTGSLTVDEAGIVSYLRKGPTQGFKSFLRLRFLHEEFHEEAQCGAHYLMHAVKDVKCLMEVGKFASESLNEMLGDQKEAVFSSIYDYHYTFEVSSVTELVRDMSEAEDDYLIVSKDAECHVPKEELIKELAMDPIIISQTAPDARLLKDKDKLISFVRTSIILSSVVNSPSMQALNKEIHATDGEKSIIWAVKDNLDNRLVGIVLIERQPYGMAVRKRKCARLKTLVRETVTAAYDYDYLDDDPPSDDIPLYDNTDEWSVDFEVT